LRVLSAAMSEGAGSVDFVDRLLAIERLDALGKAAAILEYPIPRERDEATCHQAALVVDALLVRVARARGALEVAIGDGLEALGSRKMRLGFSTIGDYAREKLGMAASTAQKMARFSRELRKRPLLRAAVWAGNVPARAAEAVLPKAIGDAEAEWVELARTSTVRALKAAVKEGHGPGTANDAHGLTIVSEAGDTADGAAVVAREGAGALGDDDEKWGPVRVRLKPEQMAVVEEAMVVAGKIVGAAAPRWKLLEALCDEYLGGHEPPDFASSPEELLAARRDERGALEEWLEQESAQWAFLDEPDRVAAPSLDPGAKYDVDVLDAELRRLSALRDRWDEVFGHVALLFRSIDGARRLGFASFEHYCTERLDMGVRSAEQRIALERKMYELPALKRAMRERRLSYE
jgi:hypothetical protein